MQALFYATPILYSPQLLPGVAKKIQMLSPIAQIIQDFRFILISRDTVTSASLLSWKFLWIPYALPLFILIVGYWVFNKMAARFAEDV
jgi:ABC-2 type transport system permease protein